jgi:hypothetical protein
MVCGTLLGQGGGSPFSVDTGRLPLILFAEQTVLMEA